MVVQVAEKNISEAGKTLAKLASKAAPVAGELAKAAAAAAGGALVYKVQRSYDKKAASKSFKETATGAEMYERLDRLVKKYNELKSKRSEIEPKEFSKRAKKMENRMARLRKKIREKEQEHRI